MTSLTSLRVSSLSANTDLMCAFPQWIMERCDASSTVLEVGAGQGKYGYPEQIRGQVARLVGIDPDGAIQHNPYIDERHQQTVEEFAVGRASEFDVVYAMFVLEHVAEPARFLDACASLLKPGGTLFAATPNLHHYFGMITRTSAALGMEDLLLERLRGRQMKESYHFPTSYRMNTVRNLARLCDAAGFREVEVRCFDNPGRFEVYLPRRARWIPRAYSKVVYSLRLPRAMGTLMLKATI